MGFQHYVLHKSDGLQVQLDQYCADQAAKAQLPPDAAPDPLAEFMEKSSKILADTFESVVGGIFEDSGYSIAAIEKFVAAEPMLCL